MGEAKDWMAYVQGTAAVANLQALRERARFSEVLHPRPSEEPPSAHLVSCHSEMKPYGLRVGGRRPMLTGRTNVAYRALTGRALPVALVLFTV